MEHLKQIKKQLVTQVEGQMGDLRCVDTKELGEVIDMIKDLAEACYYCAVTDAMEDAKENEEKRSTYYYMEKYLPYYPYDRQDEYQKGRMYYNDGGSGGSGTSNSGGGSSQGGSNGTSNSGSRSYYEEPYPMMWKDEREGRSGQKRRMYMESKATHQDSAKKIQELENYMKELTSDMMEMLADASPEEKAVVQKKVNTLATKLQNV